MCVGEWQRGMDTRKELMELLFESLSQGSADKMAIYRLPSTREPKTIMPWGNDP
jgi:hypothetical protein